MENLCLVQEEGAFWKRCCKWRKAYLKYSRTAQNGKENLTHKPNPISLSLYFLT